jgi:hypothetical protein
MRTRPYKARNFHLATHTPSFLRSDYSDTHQLSCRSATRKTLLYTEPYASDLLNNTPSSVRSSLAKMQMLQQRVVMRQARPAALKPVLPGACPAFAMGTLLVASQ